MVLQPTSGRLTPEVIHVHSKERECRMTRMNRRWMQPNLQDTSVIIILAGDGVISLASFRDVIPKQGVKGARQKVSRSLWVARPWPSIPFTAVPQEPLACALPGEWWFWQRQVADSPLSLCISCDQFLTAAMKPCFSDVATAAKMCKHQGWQCQKL